ncbi:aminomethyl-transferring glycine dehydrogenase subunit GcvPB [Dethiothermospora halolimnae]|uniref:aminomethyl-transferring glycine dehydrogenase subunit GcvPB n=1 Tax=Dethiothermospora halolimnae TaxID=3114390 RepID=UPI003CCB9875
MKEYNKLIFELSKPNRIALSLPKCDIEDMDISDAIPKDLLRNKELDLPEVSQGDLMRHFTLLSNKNYGVDTGFYPLGSCTMKYNPKINEDVARLEGFSHIHPLQPEETVQGALELMSELNNKLAEITGMEKMSLQPAAGAQGELTGLLIIKSYHENRGDHKRNKIIIPDSAHGTNPASAREVGFDVVEVKSNRKGLVDVEKLEELLDDEIAGLMLTNPNTLGLFERDIEKIADLVHRAGGLLYYDGANMNAIMGITRPGDMGFDIVHLNLHKTFTTPHGGGGPGSGPIGVRKDLVDFLPVPIIEKNNNKYILNYDKPKSVGKIKSFYGHFGTLVRTLTYILTMGAEGLKSVSETAVLNANYLMSKLKDYYHLPIDNLCKHEFVLSGLKENSLVISTLDIAKRLLDLGYHPPTIYFPLIISEAIMIEPTETESKETLDAFIDAMIQIAKEAKENPDILKSAPLTTPIKRVNEAKAARSPILKWDENDMKL